MNFSFWEMVIWRDKFLVFHHVVLTIISHLCCWVNIQYILLSGMELMRSWVFDIIWVDTVDSFFCGCVYTDLVHSGVGIYFQNYGWQWVQSFNGIISCLYLMSIGFQIILQLCSWMYWRVGLFVLGIQTFYNLFQRDSFIVGGVSVLKFSRYIFLWGWWFVLFYLATGKFHLWSEELWGVIVEEFLLRRGKSRSQGLVIWVQFLLVGDSWKIQQ